MAIREMCNSEGEKRFSVYLNVRSRAMPHIRLQKRVKGIATKSEAIRKERLILKDLSEKIAQEEGHGLTWRMVVNKWESIMSDQINSYTQYNPATIKDYVSMMHRWTNGWLDRPAAQLTRGDGREALDQVLERGKTKGFQKKLKNTINMIYNWGIEEKCIRGVHSSPVHGLKIIQKIEKRPEILRSEEIRKLLFEAKSQNHEWYFIWAAALLTGMRNGELYALKWEDIDLDNGLITVQRAYNKRFDIFKSTKAGYWRTVPISSELKRVLLELKSCRSDEFVLPRVHHWKVGQQAKILRSFCKSIGLPEVKFHTLRACFATQLIGEGVEPIKVMKICGWRDLKTMAYYLRLAGIDEKGATDVLQFIPKEEGNILSMNLGTTHV